MENWPQPNRPQERRRQTVVADRGARHPIEVVMEGAHRHDMKLVYETMTSLVVERLEPTEKWPQGSRRGCV